MMRGQRWRWGWGPKSVQSGLSRLRSPAAKVATSAAPTLPPSLLSTFAHHPSPKCPSQNTWSLLLQGLSSWLSHCPLPIFIAHCPWPLLLGLSLPILSISLSHSPSLLPITHCHCPLPEATFAAGTLPPFPLHLQMTHHLLTPHILSGFGMLKSYKDYKFCWFDAKNAPDFDRQIMWKLFLESSPISCEYFEGTLDRALEQWARGGKEKQTWAQLDRLAMAASHPIFNQ